MTQELGSSGYERGESGNYKKKIRHPVANPSKQDATLSLAEMTPCVGGFRFRFTCFAVTA